MKIKALLMASLLISFVQASETTRPIELVKLRYCDLTGSKYETSRILDLQTLEQNQKKEFCVDIINTWKEWVSIWMNIVDWTLTADSEQKRACEPEWTKSLFWDFASGYETSFFISWNSTKQIYPFVQFWTWQVWQKYGCITLHYVNDKTNLKIQWWNIDVFSRIWYFLQANVSWNIVKKAIPLKEENPLFKDIWNNDWFVIYSKPSENSFWNFFKDNFSRANIKNDWNVTMSWKLDMWYKYWWIGFPMNEQTYIIYPEHNIIQEQKLTSLIKIFGWPVNTYYNFQYDEKSLNQKNFHFFFPYIILPFLAYYFYKKFFSKKNKEKKVFSSKNLIQMRPQNTKKTYFNVKKY